MDHIQALILWQEFGLILDLVCMTVPTLFRLMYSQNLCPYRSLVTPVKSTNAIFDGVSPSKKSLQKFNIAALGVFSSLRPSISSSPQHVVPVSCMALVASWLLYLLLLNRL